MAKYVQILLIIIAVTSVAIGDVFIKQATHQATFMQAMTSKWMLIAVLLYLVQIVLFCWMFVRGWELSIVGSMQTVLYATVILGSGALIFKEQIQPIQYLGIALAYVGVFIINTFSS